MGFVSIHRMVKDILPVTIGEWQRRYSHSLFFFEEIFPVFPFVLFPQLLLLLLWFLLLPLSQRPVAVLGWFVGLWLSTHFGRMCRTRWRIKNDIFLIMSPIFVQWEIYSAPNRYHTGKWNAGAAHHHAQMAEKWVHPLSPLTAKILEVKRGGLCYFILIFVVFLCMCVSLLLQQFF